MQRLEKNEQGTNESSQQATDTNETIWQIWRLEILSSLLALGCVLAIIIILALHQSKPLPKWLGVMSVNTLVATFTEVYKASLIIPVAEGLGALITIAALAIDPISQAMFDHKGCSRAADSVNGIIAEIPRANHYTAGPMDSDIVKGLADPQELASLTNVKCATGNCTFGNGDNGNEVKTSAPDVRCRLYACVKRYHSKVQDGVYLEVEHPDSNEILTWHDEWTLVANSSLVNGKKMSCTARERWAPQTVRVESVDGGPFQLSPTSRLSEREGDKTFGRRNNVIWKFVPPECVWRIDAISWRAITSTLQDILQNNVTHSMLDGRPGVITGPTWLKQVYAQAASNISKVENLARGLASSMTAGMRNTPYDGLDDKRIPELYSGLRAVVGVTLIFDTCVSIHWLWVVNPIALLVLQWTFCALMLANRRSSPSNGGQQYMA
ncbi:hypothetical protein CPAR01_00372 [Colletotrichum paranaense]|uniref:Uncharacterized protein n=1 Tax=Colletotrichum paranaense TaxID=1914294 RepID=A0ABQ9T3Q9_9PEZI|nr:uncharacterized protein CPAR01_00372 [Colletotrichum paranaense]KAK1546405.1 hypothetical protein CPAR01_00372 [Colletotrichum paranaense]